jgi:hypothetical protein
VICTPTRLHKSSRKNFDLYRARSTTSTTRATFGARYHRNVLKQLDAVPRRNLPQGSSARDYEAPWVILDNKLLGRHISLTK